MNNRFSKTISLALISSSLVFSGCQQKKENEEAVNHGSVGGGSHLTNSNFGGGSQNTQGVSNRGGFGSSAHASGAVGG